MIRRSRFLLAVFLTACSSVGCSSLALIKPDPMSAREGAVRDRLWSESVLVRGASPDEKVATLIMSDTFDAVQPTGGIEPNRVKVSDADASALPGPGSDPTACPSINCKDDWNNLAPEFCRDVDCVLNCHNLGVLLAAGGVSYLFHETIDDDVAEGFERHPNRWGKGQEIFAGIGNPAHHFAAIGGLYLYSLHTQDAEIHDLSITLFDALSITGLTTIALKATIGSNTTAPNREPDPFGGAWPSGHTSSSFAFAAVLDEYYGHKIGIPAYVLAGLVGWERIDDGEHDLSDVVFGAVLGYVIGKTVAAEHHFRFCGMEMQPMIDPATGSTGVCFERRF